MKHSYIIPLAFTQEGVSMLSGVLRSPVAIAANIRIMRAFVAARQLLLNPPINEAKELQYEVRRLKEYVEEIFTDQNDINEDTRIQLELINESLAELQAKKKEAEKPCRRIGFDAIREKRKNMAKFRNGFCRFLFGDFLPLLYKCGTRIFGRLAAAQIRKICTILEKLQTK